MLDIERAQLTQEEIAQLAESREIQEPELDEISGGIDDNFRTSQVLNRPDLFRDENFRMFDTRRGIICDEDDAVGKRQPEGYFCHDSDFR